MRFLLLLYCLSTSVLSASCFELLASHIKDGSYFLELKHLLFEINNDSKTEQALDFSKHISLSLSQQAESQGWPLANVNTPQHYATRWLWSKRHEVGLSKHPEIKIQERLRAIRNHPQDKIFGYYLSGKENIEELIQQFDLEVYKITDYLMSFVSLGARVLPFGVLWLTRHFIQEDKKNVFEGVSILVGIASTVFTIAWESILFTDGDIRSHQKTPFLISVKESLKDYNSRKIIYQGFNLKDTTGRVWHFDFMFENSTMPRLAFIASHE